MTREEAIEWLNRELKVWEKDCLSKHPIKEALSVAIEALEQEPSGSTFPNKSEIPTSSDDCISREDALMCLTGKFEIRGYEPSELISIFSKRIKALPSATPIRPKGHWIETAEEYYKAINEKGGGVNDNTPYFVEDIACSECLTKFCIVENEVERFDFCPNCGAEMSEVKV